jgi:hypothetical protein
MKILKLSQMSTAESFADRKWVDGKIKSKTFDEVAVKFPECLIEIENEDCFPNWGDGWYKRGENNVIELWRENWDSSG